MTLIYQENNLLSYTIRLSCKPISYQAINGYYVAYELIILLCTFFMFIEMKFIHCHYCVMLVVKSMSICND